MTRTLFENARLFDGVSEDCPEGVFVLTDGGVIAEVSDRPIAAPSARRIDVGGRTLMPGLIDLHIHACASNVDGQASDRMGEPYRTAHATRMLPYALHCGFTTVRDVGGGDFGLSQAVADGLIRGPRFLYAGRAISMTGGHGDMRSSHESRHVQGYCSCGEVNSWSVVADGVDACVKAAREELRRGAHCIKILGSGGVDSPTDPVWMNQFREDEIRAIVQECEERRTYVAAHCHPASAIRRSIDYGVRCIEHGTLMDAKTAAFAAERGAFVVPTLVILSELVRQGAAFGMSKTSQAKAAIVEGFAVEGLDHMRSAGVKVGFGSDLLGELYVHQGREFTLRSRVYAPVEILRQATSIAAEILNQSGVVGCVTPGACADLIVVDGDPLKDISLLAANGDKLALVMRAGEIVRSSL